MDSSHMGLTVAHLVKAGLGHTGELEIGNATAGPEERHLP